MPGPVTACRVPCSVFTHQDCYIEAETVVDSQLFSLCVDWSFYHDLGYVSQLQCFPARTRARGSQLRRRTPFFAFIYIFVAGLLLC